MHLITHEKRIYHHYKSHLSRPAAIGIFVTIGLIFLGAVLWFFIIRKKKQNAKREMYGLSANMPPAETQGYPHPQGYTVPQEQSNVQGNQGFGQPMGHGQHQVQEMGGGPGPGK